MRCERELLRWWTTIISSRLFSARFLHAALVARRIEDVVALRFAPALGVVAQDLRRAGREREESRQRQGSHLRDRRPALPDLRRLVEGVGELQHAEVVAVAADDLDAHRQIVRREA